MNLAKVIKWELRRWREHFDMFLILAAGCLAVVFLLPMPNVGWHIAARILVIVGSLVAIVPFAVAAYMMLVYPFVLIAGTEIMKVKVLERGNGRSVVGTIVTRVIITVLTSGLGFGIFWLTFQTFRPIAENYIGAVYEVLEIVYAIILLDSIHAIVVFYLSALFFCWFAMTGVKGSKLLHLVYFAVVLTPGIVTIFMSGIVNVTILHLVASVVMLAVGCVALDRYAEQEVR